MSSLTMQVVQPINKKVPLLLEIPLDQALEGPFLVSSSKGFLWIAEKFPTGIIRAAIRKAPIEFLYREALIEAHKKSVSQQWGNVQPPSKLGLEMAIAHLSEYGFSEVEICVGDGFDQTLIGSEIQTIESVWVPDHWAVVLPKDKSYVGTSFDFSGGRVACVIHNASRGIGMVVPESIADSSE